MNKTERLYAFAMRRRVVNVDDLSDYAGRELGKDYKYLYTKYIHRLLAQGKLVRVTRGVYAARNVYSDDVYDNIDTPPDKYLVGSKIRPDYYLGYHSALELHGCAYSTLNSTTVVTAMDSVFRPFSYGHQTWSLVSSRDMVTEVETLTYLGQPLKVSSPSRTFVECVRRPDLCFSLEEVVKSIDGLEGVTIEGLESAIGIYGYTILYRSVGLFLEIMREGSPYYRNISDADIERLRARTGGAPAYLVNGEPSHLDRGWNLYVPDGLDDMIAGVI